MLAALVAFTPSFAFVLLGAGGFQRLRDSDRAQAFLGGAGPAAAGAILGTAVPLVRALSETWQYAVLAGAAVLLLVLRRGVVPTLLVAGRDRRRGRSRRRQPSALSGAQAGDSPQTRPGRPRRGTVPRRVSAGHGRLGPRG